MKACQLENKTKKQVCRYIMLSCRREQTQSVEAVASANEQVHAGVHMNWRAKERRVMRVKI